jgi:hypothetical protein
MYSPDYVNQLKKIISKTPPKQYKIHRIANPYAPIRVDLPLFARELCAIATKNASRHHQNKKLSVGLIYMIKAI